MKKYSDGSVSYSWFEVEMSNIFFAFQGGSTESLEKQTYWSTIQRLKKLAQDELLQDTLVNVVAAEHKMHPTLGESAASDSESNPAPKRVI